jgi:hypothetical protein
MRPVWFWPFLAIAYVASCVGCGNAINMHTVASPYADFARYQTFTFGPPQGAPYRYTESERTTRAEQLTEEMVTAILGSKGYARAVPADLTIRIAAGLRRKQVPILLPAPPPGGPPNETWFTEKEGAEILEGALVIDVYESASGSLVWHGAAQAAIDPDHFDEERLRRAVSEVMSSFPARR